MHLLEKINMNLNITRPNGEIDTYTIPAKGIDLSSFLATLVQTKHDQHDQHDQHDEGQSDQEDAKIGDVDIVLPVTFEDVFMKVVESYLTYFAREPLPLKLVTPIVTNINILHPRVYEWLQDFSFNQLANFREICMYFDLVPLIEQIDGILAISLVKNPKEVFKNFHEPTLTLASRDSVTDEFPILN